MPASSPIEFQFDLYEYWLGKRGERAMPARKDIDPTEIPALLPYLILADKVGDKFRYRLVGTAIVQEVGIDPTGSFAGSYVSYDPTSVAAFQTMGNRLVSTGRPHLADGQYELKPGFVHNFLALLLPLSDDGTNVSMVLALRIARFSPHLGASRDWLKGVPLKLSSLNEVQDAADLERQCLDWEGSCQNFE
jgi:hypothetical protein